MPKSGLIVPACSFSYNEVSSILAQQWHPGMAPGKQEWVRCVNHYQS